MVWYNLYLRPPSIHVNYEVLRRPRRQTDKLRPLLDCAMRLRCHTAA